MSQGSVLCAVVTNEQHKSFQLPSVDQSENISVSTTSQTFSYIIHSKLRRTKNVDHF